jgi:hypothetical protein
MCKCMSTSICIIVCMSTCCTGLMHEITQFFYSIHVLIHNLCFFIHYLHHFNTVFIYLCILNTGHIFNPLFMYFKYISHILNTCNMFLKHYFHIFNTCAIFLDTGFTAPPTPPPPPIANWNWFFLLAHLTYCTIGGI